MKKLIIILLACLVGIGSTHAQITAPLFPAFFGVDGEVKAGYFNGLPALPEKSHDWFSQLAWPATNRQIIDTTGASFIESQYLTNTNFRRLPFFRTMKYDQFEVVDGMLLIDAVYIRDYHGVDSTAFAISNKNGDSPAD